MTGTDQIRKGRLGGDRSNAVAEFLSSATADRRIAYCDLRVDMAHILMLAKQNLIDPASAKMLLSHLHRYMEKGLPEAVFDPAHEDIHAGIEAQLIADCGADVGGRMHLGRSRNDEVATCLRMQTRLDILEILGEIATLRRALIEQAAQHTHSIMPGFTHFQHAQPTTLAHYLLAYESVFARDAGRLFDAYARLNVSPLGSAAFAGTGFALDREVTAAYLGFDRAMTNSMDGVASRDFMLEVLAALSILMTNVSRLCEELILWSSAFIRFVELDDAYCSTSSIMPQKKNPDIAELVRGKSGRVFGDLTTLLTVMKGLPLAYNKDMQEDKEAIFDAFDTVKMCLTAFIPMIDTMTVLPQNMRKAAAGGFINATDCADYLVGRGLPFRDAYKCTGELVALCIEKGTTLEELPLEEYRQVCDLFEEGVYDAISLERCVSQRTCIGAPAPENVRAEAARVAELVK